MKFDTTTRIIAFTLEKSETITIRRSLKTVADRPAVSDSSSAAPEPAESINDRPQSREACARGETIDSEDSYV